MRLEVKKISILTILGLLLLFSIPRLNHVSGASTTKLQVDPYLSLAIVDETFHVAVKVTDVQDLFSWQVTMSFDPAVLEAIDVIFGNFLANQPQGTYKPPPLLNNTHGWLGFAETTLGRQPGVNGSGTLAIVTFRVKAKGESFLNITDPVPITSTANATTILLDSSYTYPNDIPFISEDGIVIAELTNFYDQFLALNTSYYSLLSEYQDLLSEYDELESEFASLNATYTSLLDNYTQLQTDKGFLQKTYDSLSDSYSTLERDYNNLQDIYNLLNSTYNSLKADYDDLKSKYETSTAELGTGRNLNYVLITTIIVFVVSAAYLLGRRSKLKPT